MDGYCLKNCYVLCYFGTTEDKCKTRYNNKEKSFAHRIHEK